MDINRQNMNDLFKVVTGLFTDGLQRGAAATDPKFLTMADFTMEGRSTTASGLHAWLNQIAGMREWVGDRVVENIASNKLEAINKDFESTVAMDRNDIEDDQYGLYSPLFMALGQNAAHLWYDLGVLALLANGKWVDGKDFFATDRTYGSSTIANKTTSALESSTFQTAWQAMLSYRGQNNKPLSVTPRTLVVGPKLWETGWNLVKNNFIVGGTTNKAAQIQNPMVGVVSLKLCPELVGDYDDYWFLLGEKAGIQPVYVQKRKDPELVAMDKSTDENVFMKRQIIYGADARGTSFLTLPHLAYAGIVA